MNSGTDFPLLSLFEMPFPVWRHACKTGRKNISKHLPLGQALPELSEEDYRLWYARYLNHIAKNYNEFLEGIMSGFPEPQYPPEVQDMIINYKIKMSINSADALRPNMLRDGMFTTTSSTGGIIKQELDDGELFPTGKDRGGNAVVIEYGHHTDLDIRKRKMEEDFLEFKAKQSRINEFDRRLSRDSVPSSLHSTNGPCPTPGFSFKSEDEFKYKVKSLILYYLDKTLLEKNLIDAHTKKAKVPETTLPNPYASHKPTQAAIGFDIQSQSPNPYSERDRDRRQLEIDRRRLETERRYVVENDRRHIESKRIPARERLGKVYDRDRFQRSNSNSGSERSMNHIDRDVYHKSNKPIKDRRTSSDRNRDRRGRDKKLDDVDVSNTIVVIPKPESSCEKCRKGEECWDC